MFILSELKDKIRVVPQDFNMNLSDAIRDVLNRKLANKVLLDVGLCIALKDIIELGDSIILPGDGASHTEVTFRYIVFRPFVNEVLTGKIRSCNRDGVHVTLGFFDDILIPPEKLQHPSRFDETEQVWIWEYPTGDDSKHDLYMDVGDSIKFRVIQEIFEECTPDTPSVDLNTPCTASKKIPYRILGGIDEDGLGNLRWWETSQDEEGEEAAE